MTRPGPADPQPPAPIDLSGFTFAAALRALERRFGDGRPPGEPGGPAGETVFFRGEPSLAFPPGEVGQVGLVADPVDGWLVEMNVPFLSLYGSCGVLPVAYTDLVIRSLQGGDGRTGRLRDSPLRRFLDLFNHRLVALYCQAERACTFPPVRSEADVDPIERLVLEVLGIHRLPRDVPARVVVAYAGFFALLPRPAAALEQMLGDHFRVPARVRPWQGRWVPFPSEDGRSLAAEYDVNGTFRLSLGPMEWPRYRDFIPVWDEPGYGTAFRRLVQLTRLFVGAELEFDLELLLTWRANEPPDREFVDWACWGHPLRDGDVHVGLVSAAVCRSGE